MVKGFTQQEGIDYDETFFPIVRVAFICLILSVIAQLDLELYQMDVKTAFLNGEVDEEIYMTQPMGFLSQGIRAQSVQAQTFHLWTQTVI